MSQPVWITKPGDLGIFPSGAALNVTLTAHPVFPANSINYVLLNGSLPDGSTLSSTGVISGTPKDAGEEKKFSFTVRAIDEFGNLRDGVFSMIISVFSGVRLLTAPGRIIDTTDSEYISYKLQYQNPVETNIALFRVSSGQLPPGLSVSTDGLISGWPSPPVLSDRSPTSKEYMFSVTVSSELGSDTKNYSIRVNNKQQQSIFAKRNPAILNSKPLLLPLSSTDPFIAYYTLTSTKLDSVESGKYFSFKVIGYDFDRDGIVYNFSDMPTGLVGDPVTGWVSGIPTVTGAKDGKFIISVFVSKISNPSFKSAVEHFILTVRESNANGVVWNSPSNLGTFKNGTISELSLSATAAVDLTYRVTSGALPPNITLTPSGELVGRFPFQPERQSKKKGETSTFTFEVSVFTNGYLLSGNTKTFTLSVFQRFAEPVETLYFKAAPNVSGRRIIQSLLSDETLMPQEYMYRPTDPYFGKASQIRIDHQYGVVAAQTQTYLSAIPNNHYRQKFVFDELKTAIARDENNNIIYEVVYAQLIDPATNSDGKSVPMNIAWPQDIGLRFGEWYDSRTDKFTSSESIFTSFTPGYVKLLTPVSLENMRKEIEMNMVYDYDQVLLPKWMTSQQVDGNTLGFTEAWVLCYTLPGKSEIVKTNINANWAHQLSDIDFEIDRFIVDRSATYNWNARLETPIWGNLPSAYPAPASMEQYDDIILFNRETILPKT